MNGEKIDILQVPGATLSYEVRGKGPLLLLIHGGGGAAYVFNGIVNYLADQYTVVTYDRRGLSNSQLDDPQEQQLVETHSEDAHRLLEELGTEYEPACVFGSSGGAVVGLDLVARYPEQVRLLIAHEPPTHLLPDADPIEEMAAIREIYHREGVVAALQKLASQPGLSSGDHEPDIELLLPADRNQIIKNMTFFFEHEMDMIDRYQFDFVALKNALTQSRILLAGGRNKQDAGYKSGVAVAEHIGTSIVEFPGEHTGYGTHPRAFARRLLDVLGSQL